MWYSFPIGESALQRRLPAAEGKSETPGIHLATAWRPPAR